MGRPLPPTPRTEYGHSLRFAPMPAFRRILTFQNLGRHPALKMLKAQDTVVDQFDAVVQFPKRAIFCIAEICIREARGGPLAGILTT